MCTTVVPIFRAIIVCTPSKFGQNQLAQGVSEFFLRYEDFDQAQAIGCHERNNLSVD